LLHVRHKKDSEDADDRIETGNRQAEIEHAGNSKLEVPEGALSCLGLGKLNQVFGKIDSEDESFCPHSFRCGNCGSTAPTADIQDS
jgi:hypothetical protein